MILTLIFLFFSFTEVSLKSVDRLTLNLARIHLSAGVLMRKGQEFGWHEFSTVIQVLKSQTGR